ncbi:MAG: ATP-dependent DNA helicase RecG [Oscillospiraceae bacterium]|nr:ATP-dependent DNA helicase RecG [Oscillospiraceae bacterium]
MEPFRQNIRTIKGIGEKRAQALNKLGVFSLFDLISFFPRRYEDRSTVKPIALVQDGESVCITAVVADEPRLSHIRRGLDLVRLRAYDDSAEVSITYFNQSYVKNQLHRGQSYRFYGRMEVRGRARSLTNPVFEPEEGAKDRISVTGRIVPVYRLSAGLQQKGLRQSVRYGLDSCRGRIPEVLPLSVREAFGLPEAEEAYKSIHFPEDLSALELARRRFVFEELFVLSCALGARQQTDRAGIVLPKLDFNAFFASLPFSPTAAQRRAIDEAAADLASGRRMSRLLQGDVGSGKTLVAAALVWQCVRAGCRAAFMAPTEILAEQHYRTLSGFLAPLGVRVGLLTGSLRASEKRQVREAMENGTLDLVIGTHALLSDGVRFPGLALAITDEQHRFGVEQRSRFGQAAGTDPDSDLFPHVYVMSATPIPRTLALIIYGDLSLSALDELPPGRQKVDTFSVGSAYHPRLLAFIRKLCNEGRQVFVVCPKVEEEDADAEAAPAAVPEGPALLSAVEYADRLRRELPELRIGCVHGKMKSADKDAVMQQMLSGELDVLVATTVIEVGVDIPNAALMLVENADRFGLSQLHQLRGRVGRGQHKSYCVLVTDSESEDARSRMKIMCETGDGFKIAEEDLRLRGPGDFFGSRQHGLPEMHVADLGTDTETLLKSKEAADRLLAEDPALSLPEHAALRERVLLLTEKMDGTLN